MKITEYITNQGTRYQVTGYLGMDTTTGRQKNFKRKGFKTKKEAQNSFTRAKHEFNTGCYSVQSKTLTYEQVYREWWEQYKLDVKESTLLIVSKYFKLHILPELGKYKLDKITPALFQKAINTWYKHLVRYKMVYSYACRIFTYAIQQGYLNEHPKHRIVVPKAKPKQTNNHDDFYTKEELQLFLDALHKDTKTMWYVFFRVLAFTGMRKGEALALTWRDINFVDKTITINKTVSCDTKGQLIITTPKTRNSNRTIQIDDNTLHSLKQWRTEQARYLIGLAYRPMQQEQLIFANLKNNSINNTVYPTLLLKRICQKHQLKEIKVHGFRHTHCSLLFEAGVPMKDVKERLGHTDIKTTMNIYTHVTKNSKEQSAQLFANYVNF